MEAFTNSLINESSPYLLQHAHNPVNWMPWGKKALEMAKAQNKPIIVSIGYAACHWCHVMEHESFEDSLVADFMNEHFICIKVDREERPDVDQVYMTAVHLMNQRGGWPLNCICLPDGRPIFGGTYFPKKEWLNILDQVNNLFLAKPDKAYEYAEKLSEGIKQAELIGINPEPKAFSINELNDIYPEWSKRFDKVNGGKNGAPKFPMPNNYEYLLQYYYHTKEESALDHCELSLDHMAMSGIYDQAGGGFARYSTDAEWKIPHFEKMLYDNAQLVSLYSHAYQLTKKPLYKHVVYQTLEFIEREMLDENGGFYSSLDADSEGEEGKFYVWEKNDIDSLLGGEREWLSELFTISKTGNWEHGKNVLHRKLSLERFAKKQKWSIDSLNEKLSSAFSTLMSERDKRVRPGLDDKILTSWNALMLSGYTDAYLAFGEKRFLDKALQNARFIKKHMVNDDFRLWRNHKNGKSNINAFLDDYSLSIEAFVKLYQASFDIEWLKLADGLAQYTIKHFYNPENELFFYTSDLDDPLIARKSELSDNVIPGSNSSLAKGLFWLSIYFDKPHYLGFAKNMLHNIFPSISRSAPYYSNWQMLALQFAFSPYEVAIVGKDAQQKLLEMNDSFLPNVCFLGGQKESGLSLLENKLVKGRTMIYVCFNKSCQLPVEKVSEALKQLQ